MKYLILLTLLAWHSAYADIELPIVEITPSYGSLHCSGLDIFQAISLRDKSCLLKSIQKMDVNESDLSGDAPLHFAIRLKNVGAITILLKHGADLQRLNSEGFTSQQLADALGNRFLSEYLANLELESTRLARAVDENNLPAVKLALLRGAPIGTRNIRLDTLLHRAVQSGFTEMEKLLLGAGENIEARNYLGETALHEACLRDDYASLKLLLEAGANVNAVNFRRETALDIAESHGASKLERLLKEFGATHGARADVEMDLTGSDGLSTAADTAAK